MKHCSKARVQTFFKKAHFKSSFSKVVFQKFFFKSSFLKVLFQKFFFKSSFFFQMFFFKSSFFQKFFFEKYCPEPKFRISCGMRMFQIASPRKLVVFVYCF